MDSIALTNPDSLAMKRTIDSIKNLESYRNALKENK
jgi:hypothetical protein